MIESIKVALFRILSGAGVATVYHRELPENPVYPAAVYDFIDQAPVDLTEDAGVVGFRQSRFQLDVYAETVAAAEDAMERFFNLLKSYSGSVGDGLSPETSYDLVIWDEGANPDLNFEDEPTLRHIEGRSHDFMILY